MLAAAYTFSFIDRQVLNLLVDPIKADLGLTDMQISYLQGVLFVAPYVLMSVPIGRMVDAFRRVYVLGAGVFAWSLATIGCGLAGTFGQLAVARMAVGAGEASVTPAAWSLLADYFAKEDLARPVSVFLMSPYIGAGLAMIFGAQVMDWTAASGGRLQVLGLSLSAWQATFVAVGAPGFLLAAAMCAIPEPPRTGRAAPQRSEAMAWSEVFAVIGRNGRLYAALLLGPPFIIAMLYGLQAWAPSILIRTHGWEISTAGRLYGVTALAAGCAGVLAGPSLAAVLRARGAVDYPLRVGLIGTAGACLAIAAAGVQTEGGAALACMAVGSFFVTLPMALFTTALQTIAPNEMRGLVAGVYVVTGNVVGLALGPTVVAFLTQHAFQDPAAVGRSLALLSVSAAPIAAILLAQGLGPYRRAVGQFETPEAIASSDIAGEQSA